MILSCSELRVFHLRLMQMACFRLETVIIICWSCAKTTLCYQVIGALLMCALCLYPYAECIIIDTLLSNGVSRHSV